MSTLRLIPTALVRHHQAPGIVLVMVIVVLGLLYVAWRTGRLRGRRPLLGVSRAREELKETRISPFTLVPLALLVIVVIVLILAH